MNTLLMMAVLPAAVLLVYIYKLDPVEKEPAQMLLRLLLFGMLSTVPAIVIELAGTRVYLGGGDPANLTQTLVDNFGIVALTEECCKFVFLRWQSWNGSNFDYVFDGIVYAVFVGLGFAISENINYVFSFGPSVALVRAFTAIPGHCVFAVFMGFFYGQAKHAHARGAHVRGAVCSVCAIVVPVACHGIYDTLASLDGDMSQLLFLAFLVLLVVVGMQLAKGVSDKAERIY